MGGTNTSRNGIGYELNFNVTIDTKKMFDIDGGTIFTDLRAQAGLDHSLDGSFGNTSHMYEPNRTQVSELWYQQSLWDDKVYVKVGAGRLRSAMRWRRRFRRCLIFKIDRDD
jgi:hypothetical protein